MMSQLYRLRAIHALLGVSVIAAYLTEDAEDVHIVLGYAAVAIVLLRLALAATGARQLGLFRFYPQFSGLKLGNLTTHPAISRTLLAGIALSLIAMLATGVMMERRIGFAGLSPIASAYADDEFEESEEEGNGRGEDEDESPLSELHELTANLLIALVAVHVAYLLAFKRPLAKFMLFLSNPASGGAAPGDKAGDG